MSETIEVGDVVRLNSDTVNFMTVNSIDGDLIECAWIDESKAQRYHDFKRSILTLVTKRNDHTS